MLRSAFLLGAVLVGSAFLTSSAFAQGPGGGFPSPEIIANADKFEPPKLTEYAVKLAQQPDMTGSWSIMQPKGAGAGPTFDPLNTFWPPQPLAGEARFGPLAGTYIRNIPYTPEYQKKYDGYVKETLEGKSRDNFAACVPYAVPRMIATSPVPFDIIQSPEVMFWYNDYGRIERRIFLDGRKHPTEPTPTGEVGRTYSGHSVGHWEGNTLVIETVAMFGGFFDETPAPFSDQITMIERLRLIDTNILEDQMTFTDPVAFTKPWLVTSYFRRGGPVGGAPPAAAASPASAQIVRRFINLNDRPCTPNVYMDDNGFQVSILPQELEAQAAAKAKKKPATTKSKEKKP